MSECHDNADIDKILSDVLSVLDLRQEHLAAALVGQALTWLRWPDEPNAEPTMVERVSKSTIPSDNRRAPYAGLCVGDEGSKAMSPAGHARRGLLKQLPAHRYLARTKL